MPYIRAHSYTTAGLRRLTLTRPLLALDPPHHTCKTTTPSRCPSHLLPPYPNGAPLLRTAPPQSSDFQDTLQRYLEALFPHWRFNHMQSALRAEVLSRVVGPYDFSMAQAALIPSVPGEFRVRAVVSLALVLGQGAKVRAWSTNCCPEGWGPGGVGEAGVVREGRRQASAAVMPVLRALFRML